MGFKLPKVEINFFHIEQKSENAHITKLVCECEAGIIFCYLASSIERKLKIMKGLLIAFCIFVASATTAKASEPDAVQSATMAKLDSITLEAQEAHLNMLVSCRRSHFS